MHCVEPNPELYESIKTKFASDIANGKLQVHNFDLADFTGKKKLYGTGSLNKFNDGMGASLLADKEDIDDLHFLTCPFVKARDWLQQHTTADYLIMLKVNCEGRRSFDSA